MKLSRRYRSILSILVFALIYMGIQERKLRRKEGATHGFLEVAFSSGEALQTDNDSLHQYIELLSDRSHGRKFLADLSDSYPFFDYSEEYRRVSMVSRSPESHRSRVFSLTWDKWGNSLHSGHLSVDEFVKLSEVRSSNDLLTISGIAQKDIGYQPSIASLGLKPGDEIQWEIHLPNKMRDPIDSNDLDPSRFTFSKRSY
jgi:hypothetical protein